MKRNVQILSTVLILAAVSFPIMAQGFGPNQGRAYPDCPRFNSDDRGPYCGFFTLDDRNLTDVQREQIKKAQDDFFKKSQSMRNDMHQKRQELIAHLNTQKPDEQKIWGVQKQISSLKEQMDREWVKYSLNIKKIAPDAAMSAAGPTRKSGKPGPYGCPARD